MAKDYKPEDIMFPDQKIVSSEIVSEMKSSSSRALCRMSGTGSSPCTGAYSTPCTKTA